jgi:predicted CopG family antitoxin
MKIIFVDLEAQLLIIFLKINHLIIQIKRIYVLGLIIKNMKRKSMSELINNLLLFKENGIEDFLPKKFDLLEKILEEIKETIEEDKYQCICSTLENTFYDKSFFIEFMKKPKFFDLLYIILEKSQDNSKNLNLIILIEKK